MNDEAIRGCIDDEERPSWACETCSYRARCDSILRDEAEAIFNDPEFAARNAAWLAALYEFCGNVVRNEG